MVAIAPPQVVNGAARAPLPYGLFSILGFRGGEERWENGVIFESLSCDPAGGIGNPDCDPETPTPGLPKDLDGGVLADGEASPFVVYGHHTCSPLGGNFARAQDLANQHLQVREEARVEQALWTGDLGNVPNLSGANGYAAPVNLGSLPLWRAVSLLEQEIAKRYGSLGTIHMSRENASRLMKEGDLVRQGGRLFTAMGTPIAAGTGYTSERIVATPALFGYRGDVFTSSNRPGDLLDRATNDLYAIAERQYLIGFDECAVLEVTIIEGGDVDPAIIARIDAAEGNISNLQTEVTSLENQQAALQTEVDGKVDSVVAGTGIAVDATDPANPIISTAP